MNRPIPKRSLPQIPGRIRELRNIPRGVVIDNAVREATVKIDATPLLEFFRATVWPYLDRALSDIVEQVNTQSQGVGIPIDATGSNITITPGSAIHVVSGAGSIETIEPPMLQIGVESDFVTPRQISAFTGTIVLIPDVGATWTLVATGNIRKASTCVVGQAMHVTFDGELWAPSY